MALSVENYLRVSFSKESSFKTAGAYTHARGLKRGATLKVGREALPIENALNSYGDRLASLGGAQTVEMAVEWYVTTSCYTDFVDMFEAAVGTKVTTASATFSSSANNTSFVKSAGTFVDIMKLTGSNGSTYICPIDSISGNTATLGIGLPVATTVTACVAPGSAGGAVFHSNATQASVVTPSTFTFDWDDSGFGLEAIIVAGCGLRSLKFVFQRDQPLQISTAFIGGQFTEDSGGPSDPSTWSAFGNGWTSDWILSSSATPLWSDTKAAIKSLSVELAPELIVERGMVGIDGGSTGASVLPGSDITGYTRGQWHSEPVTLRVPYDVAYVSAYEARTAYKLFGVLYPGITGATALSTTVRIALYWRRLVQTAMPVTVVDGGARYMDLTFQVERDTTSGNQASRFSMAFFNS